MEIKTVDIGRGKLDIIYNEDCLEGMERLPDKSIDLILTDPPFNIGKFDQKTYQEYYLWLCKVSKLMFSKLKNNKPLLIELPKVNMFDCYQVIESQGFKFEYPIILYTTNNMLRGKLGYNHYSLCLWFSKGKSKRRYCWPDVIKASLKSTKKLFRHPSPKNLEHYGRLIDLFSGEGDVILDPFIGSGTTAVACIHLKRHYIGYETDREYVKIAKTRLEAEKTLWIKRKR